MVFGGVRSVEESAIAWFGYVHGGGLGPKGHGDVGYGFGGVGSHSDAVMLAVG